MKLTRSDAWAIARLDAHEQAAQVRRGDLPGEALVEAAIQRIEDLDPALNSVSYRAFREARRAVSQNDLSATMGGVPVLLKASVAYPGFPQTSCSRARRDLVATSAFPYVRALVAEGLIPVGMTTMPEFGLLCSGEPLLTGPTLNPWNASRSAGGSSTGAAVAVAAGLVPVAHASDAGGSIRIPASNCGVIGFKPSRGGNLRARAHHLIDDLLCSDSLIARSVRDVAWGLRVARPSGIARDAEVLKRLRIAVDLSGLDGMPDGDVASCILSSAALCESLGHHVETVTLPIDRSALRAAFLTLMPYLGGDLVDHFSALHPDVPIDELLEPWTIGLSLKRASIGSEQVAAALAAMSDGQRSVTKFAEEWDIVLSPVTRSKPLCIGVMAPTRPFDELWQILFDYIDYTPLHNMIGTPSLSLPLGMTSDGLPIGSLFSGPPGSDNLLMALAAELEMAAPWADRWPSGVAAKILS